MQRIVLVEINDLRSIEHMELKAKALNVIAGTNGEGKTSIILAIKACFAGGHSPNLRRQLPDGSYVKKGSIQLTLDDRTVIQKTIREKSSELIVTNPAGIEVPSPQEFVERLASGFSFDPIQFVEAKPKERAAYLQRALNLMFAPEEVAPITGAFGLTPRSAVDMDGLDALRKQIYDLRTKENGAAKEADGTVSRLSKALDDDARDWDAEVAQIQASRDVALQELNLRKENVKDEAAAARLTANQDAEARIAEIRKELAGVLGTISAVEADSIAELETLHRPVLEQLNVELGTAQANAKKKAQVQVFRSEVATAKAARDAHAAKSQKMTTALASLDAMKAAKIEALPIPGVDFRSGEFYVGNLPFDSLNDGAKYMTAFQVAGLMPGDLGVLIADKAEGLGPENWQAFQEGALQSGFQVFVTRVEPGALDIRAIEPKMEAVLQ